MSEDDTKRPVVNLNDPAVWARAAEIQKELQRGDQPLLKAIRNSEMPCDRSIIINTKP